MSETDGIQQGQKRRSFSDLVNRLRAAGADVVLVHHEAQAEQVPANPFYIAQKAESNADKGYDTQLATHVLTAEQWADTATRHKILGDDEDQYPDYRAVKADILYTDPGAAMNHFTIPDRGKGRSTALTPQSD